jgi:PAS domain S-box-containing protein
MTPRVVGQGAGESARVTALRGLGLLDTPAEERFDRITRLAAALLDVPIALVSLIDRDRNYIKACVGMSATEVPLSTSFCAVAVASDQRLVVEDARLDPRFAHFATVVGEPNLRFYAGQPVHTSTGIAVGTLCVADVEPRTLAEQQLAQLADLATIVEDELERTDLATALIAQRASEEHVRAVMDHAGEGIVTLGHDGIVREANEAAERAFGTSPGDLGGRHIEEIVDVEWGEVHRFLPSLIGKRRLVHGRRVDGSTFPMELVLSEANVGGGKMLIAIGQDVTERFRAEAALRESEQRFRAVFDDAVIGMLLVDSEGTIVDANAAIGELLGRPTDALRQLRITELLGPDADLTMFRELMRGERDGYRRQHRLTRADGTALWSDSTISVLRDADGRPRYALGMVDDITERKEVERLKDEFVSVVGHELRTPLTSIRGSLGLLDGGLAGDLPGEAREMVALALANTNRLVRLVEDTLDLERMQAGAGELELRPVPVRELIDTAVGVVQRLASEAGLTIAVDAEQLEVLADPDRAVQALTNLLGNAVKFSPPGGTIRVAVRRQEREAELSVADEGRGIPRDQLDTIFERFRQVDASDRREKGGTGLGLAIAREIVLRSRGRIWAESEPGRGATFCFTLPLAQAALAIAVCDRREHVRDGLAARLAGLGLRAVPVADAAGLAAAAAEQPLAAVVLTLGPATAAAVAAFDADPATRGIPQVLLDQPDEPGLLSALEAGVPALRAGRVLVVEDDDDLARVLVRGVERRGFDVELARTGRDARAAIERAAPGLVILDLTLPGEDGFAVVDWLRRTGRLAAAPLLVYSGRSITEAERDRLQLGHTEFLAKASVEPAEVERRVAELLGRLAAVEP